MSKTAQVFNNRLVLDNLRYFRVNAGVMRLGSYGEKKQPVGRMHLELQGDIPLLGVPLTVSTEVDASFENGWAVDSTELLPPHVTGYGGMDFYIAKIRKGQLRMIQVSITLEGLKQALLATPLQAKVKGLGGDARLVHSLLMVVECELVQGMKSGFSASGSVTKDGMTLSGAFSTESGHATTTRFPAGATFAYLLARPTWNKAGLDRLTVDEFGIG